jgi:glycosyltransferase involved in cell wall biosynthesis
LALRRSLLIAHTESSCGWGGQEIRILEESRCLAARGHRVVVACPLESPIHREASRWGIEAHALPIARRGMRAMLATREWLRTIRPDVVNTHSSTDSWLVSIATRCLRGAPAVIRTRHISAPVSRGPLSWWLYAGVPRHVVTTGEVIRQELIRRARVPASRTTSVPTGIDPDRFHPGDSTEARAEVGLPSDRRCIGIVATLRSWKGHSYLLDAYARVRIEGWHLVIVGDGPQRANIEAQIVALGIGGRVTMAGHRQDPERWLRACDIVCQPSWANEGVPQSIVQAMMTGCAIITTDAGAIGEAVRDGDSAVVVPGRDAEALAAALDRVMSDERLRDRLGRRAREVAVAHRSIDAMTDAMERIFQSAVGRR